MAPNLIPSAKLTLSYPLYTCDFDPTDSTKLVVGGGGGAGRSGVGNRITVLDTSNANELQELAEADLRKDEDNPTSLAVGGKDGERTTVYAGVNSTLADQSSGRNQHFRAYGVHIPERPAAAEKSIAGEISEIGRSTLFASREPDTYQRVLRLSRPFPGSIQLGAATTGLAKESEVVVFDTSKPPTSPPNIRGRVIPGAEAADVDIIQSGTDEYKLAYCTDKDVFLKIISSKTDTREPIGIHRVQGSGVESVAVEKVKLPSFRALRFLTPDFMLMLMNMPNRNGVVLQVVRVPDDLKAGGGRAALSYRLPNKIKSATGLSVVNLTPTLSADAKQGNSQFAIAVASQDISLSIITLELATEGSMSVVHTPKPYKTIKDVHPLQMTSIAFAPFNPPPHPVSASTGPQYLKLASVSMGNTLVVHTLPLSPLPISLSKGQSKTPRYVLSLPSDKSKVTRGATITFLLVMIGAILMQAALEIRGGSPSYLGVSDWLGPEWMKTLGAPYPSYIPTQAGPADPAPISEPGDAAQPTQKPLHELLESIKTNPEGVVYVRHEQDAAMHETSPDLLSSLKADLYDEAVSGPHSGRSWNELSPAEKESWEEKLKEAGHWLEGEASKVFKGVVFGELGGAIGRLHG